MYCQRCGKELQGNTVCPSCGERIRDGESATPPAPRVRPVQEEPFGKFLVRESVSFVGKIVLIYAVGFLFAILLFVALLLK